MHENKCVAEKKIISCFFNSLCSICDLNDGHGWWTFWFDVTGRKYLNNKSFVSHTHTHTSIRITSVSCKHHLSCLAQSEVVILTWIIHERFQWLLFDLYAYREPEVYVKTEKGNEFTYQLAHHLLLLILAERPEHILLSFIMPGSSFFWVSLFIIINVPLTELQWFTKNWVRFCLCGCFLHSCKWTHACEWIHAYELFRVSPPLFRQL